MSRGFTLFDIAFVLLLLTLAAMVAVPGALDRVRVTDEARAVSALQWIAAAQARILGAPADQLVDRNGDGQPEYAFLPALLASTPEAAPWGAAPFSASDDGDLLELPGFYVTLLLPGADGTPLAISGIADVDPAAAARTFAAVAWPKEAGRTGYRAYYVNHTLLVHEHRNRDGELSGPVRPALPSPVLVTRNERTGAIIPPPPPGPPWLMFLRRDQAKLIESRLGRPLTPESDRDE